MSKPIPIYTIVLHSVRAWQLKRCWLQSGMLDFIIVGSGGCPLCHKFYGEGECNGCPIRLTTGKPRCLSTPYRSAYDAFYTLQNVLFGPPVTQEGLQEVFNSALVAFEAEIQFLESLVDPGVAKKVNR